MSALALAIHQIDSATTGKTGNPLKYDRRIIIVTDGRGHMDTDTYLDQMKEKIKGGGNADAAIDIVLL
jgi:ATP-dependent DNA helicase 2 subunit 2